MHIASARMTGPKGRSSTAPSMIAAGVNTSMEAGNEHPPENSTRPSSLRREVLMIPGIDVYLAHLLRRQITKATLLVGVALWLGFSILAYYWIIQL